MILLRTIFVSQHSGDHLMGMVSRKKQFYNLIYQQVLLDKESCKFF